MSEFQTIHHFEDMPLGSETIDGVSWTFDAIASGRAIIQFDRAGEWGVDAVFIAMSRIIRRADGSAEWEEGFAELDTDTPLFTLIAESLKNWARDAIEQKVRAELENEGIAFGYPNEEHSTMNLRQQGIER
jgi:hypothetical protein